MTWFPVDGRPFSRVRWIRWHVFDFTVISACFAAIGALIAAYWFVPTTFEGEFRTESVHIERVSLDHAPTWTFKEAKIFIEDEDARPFSGEVAVQSGIRVSVQRIAHGAVRVRLGAERPSLRVATLIPLDGTPTVALGRLVLVIDDIDEKSKSGEHVILPIIGRIAVGSDSIDLMSPTTGLLHGGRIRLVGHSVFSGSRFDAGLFELSAGDRFSVANSSSDGYGVIVADDSSGLLCSYREVGSRGHVSRMGSKGYDIGVSIFERCKSDKIIQATWAAFGLLYAIRKVRQKDSAWQLRLPF